MNFDDTKKFILDHIEDIKNITPSFGGTKEAVNLMLCKIEYLISNPENDPPELSQKEYGLINDLISAYLQGLVNLDMKFTPETIEVADAFANVLRNFTGVYETGIYPLGAADLICTLIGVKNSLSAQIKLNIYLISKLQNMRDYKEETSNSLLSKKYYKELSDFLNRKTNHDTTYALQDECCK